MSYPLKPVDVEILPKSCPARGGCKNNTTHFCSQSNALHYCNALLFYCTTVLLHYWGVLCFLMSAESTLPVLGGQWFTTKQKFQWKNVTNDETKFNWQIFVTSWHDIRKMKHLNTRYQTSLSNIAGRTRAKWPRCKNVTNLVQRLQYKTLTSLTSVNPEEQRCWRRSLEQWLPASVRPSLSPSVPQSVRPSVRLSVCPFVCP